MRSAFIYTLILVSFFSCKKSTAQGNENKENDSIINSSEITESKINEDENIQHWELIDVTRFFDNPIIKEDVDSFKKNIIYFDERDFVMNNIKTNYSLDKLNVMKILGKGSLYDFFKDYIKDKFIIELPNEVFYVNIGYEGATKEPFKKYFLDGNSGIIINDYMFLLSNDNYLLTYKAKNLENLRKIYSKLPLISLPITFDYKNLNDYNYNFYSLPVLYKNKLKLDKFENYFSGAKLPKINKLSPILILANDINGQSILYLYILSEKFEVLDKIELYYSYDVDSGNIVTLYNIDKSYNIKITKKRYYNDDSKSEKIIDSSNYKINDSGIFIEQK